MSFCDLKGKDIVTPSGVSLTCDTNIWSIRCDPSSDKVGITNGVTGESEEVSGLDRGRPSNRNNLTCRINAEVQLINVLQIDSLKVTSDRIDEITSDHSIVSSIIL